MRFYKIIMHIHPSIPSDSDFLQGEFEEGTKLLEGIVSILSKDQKISKIILSNCNIRPGFLFISDKTELRTTGKLDEIINEDLEIRIIPISHGG